MTKTCYSKCNTNVQKEQSSTWVEMLKNNQEIVFFFFGEGSIKRFSC